MTQTSEGPGTAGAPDTKTVSFVDGSAISLRPIGIRDGRLLSDFLTQLSPQSEYKRFLASGRVIRAEWVARLINADQRHSIVHGAFAENRFGSSLVAIGESVADPDRQEKAEFALAAIDPWQGMGVGTLLTCHMADIARRRGVGFWETHMLADNHQMARVLGRIAKRVELTVDAGLSRALYDLDPLAFAR